MVLRNLFLSKEQRNKIILMEEIKVMMKDLSTLYKERSISSMVFSNIGNKVYDLGKRINNSI